MAAIDRLLSVALILFSTVSAAADQARHPAPEMKNGKPVYEVCSFIVAPGTLSGMYEASDAVLEVRVDASEGKAVLRNRPRTFYTANVTRVLKGALNKDQTVVFSQAAGEVELPDQILRANDQHTLAVGDRYIVFLRRHEPYGGYILTGEREGAFRIRKWTD